MKTIIIVTASTLFFELSRYSASKNTLRNCDNTILIKREFSFDVEKKKEVVISTIARISNYRQTFSTLGRKKWYLIKIKPIEKYMVNRMKLTKKKTLHLD